MLLLVRPRRLEAHLSCDWLTEKAPYPDCQANRPGSPWFSLTHLDELALIRRTMSATERSGLNFAMR